MRRPGWTVLSLCGMAMAATLAGGALVRRHLADTDDTPFRDRADGADAPAAIVIDYPAEQSIFPPDMAAPTFLWHDAAEGVARWRIKVTFADGSAPVFARSAGAPPRIGEIDPRCIGENNELPRLSAHDAAARTWVPDAATWARIKRSAGAGATVTIAGLGPAGRLVSRGGTTLFTSRDPVAAPIFYRDVPLMPVATTGGAVQPLAKNAFPLVAWRLRDVGKPHSRLLLTDMYTCANCHSFSRDGKTLGIDLDGPQNDKGTYALAPIGPQMSIKPEHVITWNSFAGKPSGQKTIGFMAQISPDGRFTVVTLNESLYVQNFTDYRFLQVFYPTRGILGYHDRETGAIKALPGADDPRYVHTGAAWSPDGRYLVFSRAEATDPYPRGRPVATHANDPNEVPIQYDLCRIPFNGGAGGVAEPIAGASRNGKSNSFPKVSPDGRWIVYVQCQNGLLMRPDSRLWIVPAQGGTARLMRCNTPRMNSWHSFSPNGRWLVFSSKGRSPYTQMFLTHLDEEGRDSPPILIENATAANRAVNLPEFVNLPPDGLQLLKIDVPASEVYRFYDLAMKELELGQEEQQRAAAEARIDKAIDYLRRAEAIDPDFAETHNHLGGALGLRGRADESITHYRRAITLQPDHALAHYNLGHALSGRGRPDEAVASYRRALEIKPDFPEAHFNLALVLAERGLLEEAIGHAREAVEIRPALPPAHHLLGRALADVGRADEAVARFQQALQIDSADAESRRLLGLALARRDAIRDTLARLRESLRASPDDLALLDGIARLLATAPFASLRNGAEAVELAERADRLAEDARPEIIDTLAAAYAESGRFDEAVRAAGRALALAERRTVAATEAVRGRMRLYEAGRPFHEPLFLTPAGPRPR